MIGITGGIGSGKSVVSRILRCRGFEVYDCDMEAKRIMDCNEAHKRDIASRLGKKCLDSDGRLCRAEIARRVFSDESDRLWLNSRVHALVLADVMERKQRSNARPFFVESAILKSSGLAELCRCIWLVETDMAKRIERVCYRDGIGAQDVMARIDAQQNEYANFNPDIKLIKIDNSGETSLLENIQKAFKASFSHNVSINC